jgi:hypothetical protein
MELTCALVYDVFRSLFGNAPPYDNDGRDGCAQVRPLFALHF